MFPKVAQKLPERSGKGPEYPTSLLPWSLSLPHHSH